MTQETDMTPDHPNARILARHYEAMASVMHPASPGSLDKSVAFSGVAEQVMELLAPDFVIHTGGIRLAATGGREFTMAMGMRRNAISGGTFRPTEALSIVADNTYAIVRGVFGADHGGQSYLADGLGVWRFNTARQATEHWELGPGHQWDEFFIGCDPGFVFSSGEEFWLKDVNRRG